MQRRIVGIDLGTTHSLVGAMDAGFPLLIKNREGRRLTASAVHWDEHGNPVVGAAAKRSRAVDPRRTVTSIKRFMGRRWDELTPDERDAPFPLERGPDGGVALRIGDALHTPESVSSLILAQLKSDAEADLETEVSRAVITVPAYFNDAQRSATKRAGELAGFQVERILNEPTAAALAYGFDKGRSRGLVAVYDFGGGTFDLTLLELNLGVFEVRATHGHTRLGGDDIDRALVEAWLAELPPGCRADPVARGRLVEEAERAKIALSDADAVEVRIPFLTADLNFERRVTRTELEALARPLVERTRPLCLRALADAQLRAADLDAVLLVGGQTRMPLVRRVVAELFQTDPLLTLHPDEAVALGATLQAGILEGNVRDMVLLDVTPLSLGLETFGGLMNVVIPRNTTIPTKAGEMFTTAVPQQPSIQIRVLQGEREMARDNWVLGEFSIDIEPAPKGVPRVGVQFEIDADGILNVLARDIRSGLERRVALRSAVDVADDAVEAMIAESVEHAVEDFAGRRWAETNLKSQELLAGTRHALDFLGDRLSSCERAEIEDLMSDVAAARASRDIDRLLRANAALDAGTQSLAERLIDAALSDPGKV